MNLLNKENILAANDLPLECLAIPEWGGDVMVRTMTGADRDAFEASLIGKEGRMENVRARLVSLTLCDANGVRLFTDAEVAELGNKSAKALDRVFTIVQRINGIVLTRLIPQKKSRGSAQSSICISAGASLRDDSTRTTAKNWLG